MTVTQNAMRIALALFLLAATACAAGEGNEDVKLLTGFEAEQLAAAGWTEADGVLYQGENDKMKRSGARAGDASQGERAFVRPFSKDTVNWYLKPETQSEILFVQGSALRTFGWFGKLFPKDWSGYEKLRIDAKSTNSDLQLEVLLEDELISPMSRALFAVPKGEWVTLEIDLAKKAQNVSLAQDAGGEARFGAKALAVRGLNPARMANIYIRVIDAKEATDVLIDNVRLLKKGAQDPSALKVVPDGAPAPVFKPLPCPSEPLKPQPAEGAREMKPDPAAGVQRFEQKMKDSYGLFTMPRALAVADARRMLMGNSIGRVQVVQTLDGGKTFTDLAGKAGETTSCQHSGNAPGNVAAGAGEDLLVFYTARCGGMATPVDQYFRLAKFNGAGWTLGPPSLVCVDVRHCPEHQVRAIRLKNGRIWIAWHHIGRNGEHYLRARFSDDGGALWQSPESNAAVEVARGKTTYALGASLWTDNEQWRAPKDGQSGRVDRGYHPHSALALTPYKDSVMCIWSDGREMALSSVFDTKENAWSEPKPIVKSHAGPRSAVTLGEATVYVALPRAQKILRLDGDKWIEDAPEGCGSGVLSASGERLLCYFTQKTDAGTKVLAAQKPPGGAWSAPKVLSEETEALQGIVAPQYAPDGLAPVLWGPKSGWVKLATVPAE